MSFRFSSSIFKYFYLRDPVRVKRKKSYFFEWVENFRLMNHQADLIALDTEY